MDSYEIAMALDSIEHPIDILDYQVYLDDEDITELSEVENYEKN